MIPEKIHRFAEDSCLKAESKKPQPAFSYKAAFVIGALGVVLGGSAALAYQARSKDLSLMAQVNSVAGNCTKSFESVPQLFYRSNQQKLLHEIFN